MSKIHLGNRKTGRAFCGGSFGVPRYDTEDITKVTCRRCKQIGRTRVCLCLTEPDRDGVKRVAQHSSECPEYLGY